MNEKHQPNFIERMLMGIMQAVDTQTFSEKDKILFYKQLVYMLKGGVSILQAVDTLKRTKRLQRVLSFISMRERVFRMRFLDCQNILMSQMLRS